MTMRVFLAGAGLLALTGCLTGLDPRTSNQGGGTILTAGVKIASEQISTLTPDEIQILVDTASEANADVELPPLGDAEAAALSDFLGANNLDSIADFEQLVENGEANPDSIVIPESVRELGEAAEDGEVPEFITAILNSGAFSA